MTSATGFSASPVHRQPLLYCLAIVIYVSLMNRIYNIWYYHFSAFWLRSSVISLLVSLICYISPVPPENLAYSWLGHSSKRRSNCTQTQHQGQNQ